MAAQGDPGWRQAGELADIGLRFALVLTLCVLGGWKLDQRWACTPWLSLGGALLGMGVGGYWAFLKLRDLTRGGE